jgi:hypothetical protein
MCKICPQCGAIALLKPIYDITPHTPDEEYDYLPIIGWKIV